MKRKLLFLACATFAIYGTLTAGDEDSTIIFEMGDKRILVKENEEKQRMEVQVFEFNNKQDSVFYEQIFEGHYRDGKSSEQRKYIASVGIPNIRWKTVRFNPHWAGLGFGFTGFDGVGDYRLHFIEDYEKTDIIDNLSLNSSKSLEFNLNFYEKAFPISNRFRWAAVTGLGLRWTRFEVKGNYHFEEINDYTELVQAPEGRRYKSSSLGITSLNIPILIEWQNHNGNLFFSAGFVGSIKTWSYSRIVYYDDYEKRSKKKHKEKVDQGMTLRPITMDVLAQAGTRNLGVYFRYTPISMFDYDKGPELYPLSFGVMFHF